MRKTILAAILSLSVVASVHAITYIDTNADLVAFDSTHTTYTNNFNLLNIGYNPASETITSACAVFGFTDIWGGKESFTVNLGGNLFSEGSFSAVLLLPEVATGSALFALDETGLLTYTVTRSTGDFQLIGSALIAEASPRNVPDATASVALLGLGVIGIVAAKRRFGSAA
jgi:hypothetical protein